jgi:hypothetical protein
VIADLELAQLAGQIYDPSSRWDRDFSLGDIRVGVNLVDGCATVVPRGTLITPQNWQTAILNVLRDGDAVPIDHAGIGPLHRGFYNGMMLWADQVDKLVGDRTVIGAGHSLGAIMLLMYLARRRMLGKPVLYAATFGCPKGAFSLFGKRTPIEDWLADVLGPDYAHECDPVVPEPAIAYRHVRGNPPKILATSLASGGAFDLAYHACAGYVADLATLGAVA